MADILVELVLGRGMNFILDIVFGIRNTWKVSKCGVGEGWRRSVGPIM
jgi:hypothetical protein